MRTIAQLHGAGYCTIDCGRRWIEAGRKGTVLKHRHGGGAHQQRLWAPQAVVQSSLQVRSEEHRLAMNLHKYRHLMDTKLVKKKAVWIVQGVAWAQTLAWRHGAIYLAR